MSRNVRKVAILQHAFFGGGGTRVLVNAVEVFNGMDIVPDVYCFRGLSAEQIAERFNKEVRYNLIVMPGGGVKGAGALKIPLLNILTRKRIEQYDLIFNSQSAFLFLPRAKRIITYVHFPKRVEFMLDATSHQGVKSWLYTRPIVWFYKLENPNTSNIILVNSHYTKEVFLKYYYQVDPSNVHVLYPPVDLSTFWCERHNRRPFITSIGSFSPKKNQVAQIELARNLPEFEFHIIGGISTNPSYYQQCRRFIENHKIRNVHLHPDLPLNQMIDLLQQSRFFLHTRIGEHFGIATVEAIAAGCIPIVPNSGGQKEIVPDERLRFDSIDEIPDMVRTISKENLSDIRKSLQLHIQQFNEIEFKRKLRNYILSALP